MILLVSDDSRTRERLQSALPGRPLEQVSSVADLDDLSNDSRPAAVVVDAPDATGSPTDLPERIRGALGSGSSIWVVALVDEGTDESAADALDGSSPRGYDGAISSESADGTSSRSYDGVLEKPIDPARVESVLDAAERFSDYDDAIGTLFDLCRRRARDADADVSREEISTARTQADSCLTALRESGDDLTFARLVREN